MPFLLHIRKWLGAMFCLLMAANALAFESEKRPLKFTDISGKEIETYCVVPLYHKWDGVGWGPESQGRKTHPEEYLMWPAIVEKGAGFFNNIKEKREHYLYLVVTVITYGESISPTKFLILKKGFSPLLWDSYIDVAKVRMVQIQKGDSESVVKTLISKNPDQKNLHKMFNLSDDVLVFNKYTDEDRELLRKCYYEQN